MILRLNFRILGILLAGFISLNIIISLMFTGIILWQAETDANNLIDSFGISMAVDRGFFSAQNYEVEQIEEVDEGIGFPSFLQRRLPLGELDPRRRISSPGLTPRISWEERIKQTKYHLAFSLDGENYQLSYPLTDDLRVFGNFMLVIIIAQGLFVIGRIGDNTRMIRKTLKPLAEMAEAAKKLQEDMAKLGSTPAGDELHNLAGAIKTIDAGKLNKRISVDSSQNELKDLAHAINDMLNRINQAYESQVRFVSDASHELRTPISVIQGYAGLLDRWGKHDEKTLQESISAIKSETESMKTLVEQLLFLARGDNETIQLHKEIFDTCLVVDEIIKETRLIDPNHVFETELDSPAYIEADQQLIKQAVRILVDNSIKYTPAEETILIKVFKEEDKVKIQVQDNGIGIDPEDVPNIFDRFYRSDESRARKTGGSGLGLSIARWIVERHQGHFEVISRLDIGTRTTIVLPRTLDSHND